MAKSYGTLFEHKFKEDYMRSFPDALCFKIPNQMSGYFNINNYCDFICYDGNRMYMIDCKSHGRASFPFEDFPQYERLLTLSNVPNLITGVVLWLYEKDTVHFIPTYTVQEMKGCGLKSINPKTLDKNKFYILEIPSVKKRTFMDSDYSVLTNVPTLQERLEVKKCQTQLT